MIQYTCSSGSIVQALRRATRSPGDEFYPSEIAASVGLSPAEIQHAILRLADEQLVCIGKNEQDPAWTEVRAPDGCVLLTASRTVSLPIEDVPEVSR